MVWSETFCLSTFVIYFCFSVKWETSAAVWGLKDVEERTQETNKNIEIAAGVSLPGDLEKAHNGIEGVAACQFQPRGKFFLRTRRLHISKEVNANLIGFTFLIF